MLQSHTSRYDSQLHSPLFVDRNKCALTFLSCMHDIATQHRRKGDCYTMSGGIVSSPRENLSPQQSLELAAVYLENASKATDPDITLVLCHDTEVSLSQAEKSINNIEDPLVREGIATTYIDMGKLLSNLGHQHEAQASYKRAEKLGYVRRLLVELLLLMEEGTEGPVLTLVLLCDQTTTEDMLTRPLQCSLRPPQTESCIRSRVHRNLLLMILQSPMHLPLLLLRVSTNNLLVWRSLKTSSLGTCVHPPLHSNHLSLIHAYKIQHSWLAASLSCRTITHLMPYWMKLFAAGCRLQSLTRMRKSDSRYWQQM